MSKFHAETGRSAVARTQEKGNEIESQSRWMAEIESQYRLRLSLNIRVEQMACQLAGWMVGKSEMVGIEIESQSVGNLGLWGQESVFGMGNATEQMACRNPMDRAGFWDYVWIETESRLCDCVRIGPRNEAFGMVSAVDMRTMIRE